MSEFETHPITVTDIFPDCPTRPILHLNVKGSEGITFMDGGMTGGMTEEGVTIKTVWYAEDNRSYGGCITREDAVSLRDFLSDCISKWKTK